MNLSQLEYFYILAKYEHYTKAAQILSISQPSLTHSIKSLEKEFNNAWILWYVWTARPKNEWWNYYWFPDLENGMKAKILIIKRSYKEYTIQKYLRIWGTDTIDSQMDLSRLIWSLDDNELISLIKSQIQKESGKDMSKYVFDKIITCK